MEQNRRARVLVVDDERFYLDVMVELLSPDYDVVLAKNGEQALRRATGRNRPDLILLDVIMPDIDGHQVCRRLKANSLTNQIPVIFLTGMRDEQSELKGLELGAVDYITKPINAELLKRRVSTQVAIVGQQFALEELVRQRTHELSLTKDSLVLTMGAMAEMRDKETGNHLVRTEQFVKLLAEGLAGTEHYRNALDLQAINAMHRAAPLHDIGKVGVPDRILQKESGLDAEEYREMQRHPEYGRMLIEEAEKHLGPTLFIQTAKEIAFSHHERWDGKGYPQGLGGEDIPLAARLMAVADVYDALASRRYYKEPMMHSQVVATIEQESGSHFDPAVVEVFLARQQRFEQIFTQLKDE